MEIRGRRVMVVGMGVSGRAAARFLDREGARLVMTDARRDIDRAQLPPGEVLAGGEDPAALRGVDFVVTSPGVPRDSVLLREAVRGGTPVLSEIELASRYIAAPIVAVTGTNGKSTVTVMIGKMLEAASMRVFTGGNLGRPLIEAARGEYDAVVAEVSSFQLEWIESFRARVAVHLNLSDDHFDRYRDLQEYGAAKARLFENQLAVDWAVLNRDDPNIWQLASSMRARVFSFGLERAVSGRAIWPEDGALAFDCGDARGRIGIGAFKLAGRHNLVNAMAASAAALAMGATAGAIERALSDFRALPHRIEFVSERNGVKFIDDSKGTNVGAVVEALAAFDSPVILIAGGVDKGGDYSPLFKPLRDKARLAIFIGAARSKMSDALSGATEIELAATLKEAVARAAKAARPGDVVLLSPACASFDQFTDYAERGKLFQELVRAL
ncbi:MAG: UDP-N-acetylmuramoyl-L-alanine--D-glutamate ligase [Candidatus Binataceae bacterium]